MEKKHAADSNDQDYILEERGRGGERVSFGLSTNIGGGYYLSINGS